MRGLRDASIPLGADLPPVEKLAGTVRFGGGQLRGLALEGSWLGGPVEIESRRAAARGGTQLSHQRLADAAPLLQLLGTTEVASRVSGQTTWTGTAQRRSTMRWQVSLASNLAGVESRLPEPFDKSRARALPVSAQLRVDANGIQEFSSSTAVILSIRGARGERHHHRALRRAGRDRRVAPRRECGRTAICNSRRLDLQARARGARRGRGAVAGRTANCR